VQVELGEPGEDAGTRHGEAVEAQEERDGGGLVEAGELKDASLRVGASLSSSSSSKT
jgi:hypothetical protein